MELPPTIARAIEKMGFAQPTEVQARAIGPLREGKDLIGQAQTGTGKTAAFGIPIVEKVDPSARHVQALVLTPTRELCVQVTEEIRRIGVFRNVGAVAIYGGSSMDSQISALKRGVPVVVGTPGRVLDLIRRGELRLDRVNTVILDEADRMLDMGFIVDVETILSRCPRNRQTALFSATMPYAILRICDRFMDENAEHIVVRPEKRTVETVRQLVYFVAEQDKVRALLELAGQFGIDRLLVFRHTQIGVDRLAMTLKRRGKNVAALHGGMSQRERTGRWPTSRPARSSSWWPPTSPAAGWTSPTCPTSSPTTSRRTRTPTSTASGAPPAPARRGPPSPSSASGTWSVGADPHRGRRRGGGGPAGPLRPG